MDIFHKLHEEQGKTIILITHSNELADETQRIIAIMTVGNSLNNTVSESMQSMGANMFDCMVKTEIAIYYLTGRKSI